MPYLSPKTRFTTAAQDDQKNAKSYLDKTRSFGRHQAREMRKNVDLTTKQYVLDSKPFTETCLSLKKQLNTNIKSSKKAKQKFNQTMMTSNESPSGSKWLQTSFDYDFDANASILSITQ